MRYRKATKGTVAILATALTGTVFATGAAAWVNPLKDRYIDETYSICDQGGFFVGGVPKVTNYASSATAVGQPEQLIIGQAYVQFQIPKERLKYPLIMVHGSGYSGSALDATPDGREGWFPYAVRHGLATFIMDQAGRARSGFDRSVFHEARVTGNLSLIPTLGGGSSNNIWTSWFGHIIPAGTNIVTGTMIRHGDPGDPDLPEDFSLPSSKHGNYPPAYPIPPVKNSIDPKIAARVGAIGPAPNPANNQYLALESYKYLVPNTEVTLPGSTCGACVPSNVGPAETWTGAALAELVEGLGGAIVSPHSQSTTMVMHMVRLLKEHGKLHLLKGIIIPEGAGTQLAPAGLVPSDFDTVPFLIVNGDYRADASRITNRTTVDQINSSPTRKVGPATYVDTETLSPQKKWRGQTHMNMLGTNNLDLFDYFLAWSKKNIDNPSYKGGCASGDDDRDQHDDDDDDHHH
jgi:hypothetical protein